jgi:hypothetical protein
MARQMARNGATPEQEIKTAGHWRHRIPFAH